MRSLWLAVRGRVDGVDVSTVPLTYHAGIGALMGTVTGLSVLELAVVHLVVPWPVVRVVLLVLGAATVLVMLDFWAGLRTRPHLVGADGIRLRYAGYLSLALPWSAVGAVRRVSLHEPTRVTVRDGRLHLPVTGSTNLLLELDGERDVPLLLGRVGRAREVAFVVDDPTAAVRAIAEHIGRGDGPGWRP